jgi:site-specific DNA-methyltransferase (adenine-specific)
VSVELPTEADPVRIVCGDCLDLMREMPDGCVNAVITDPPYGCDKAEWDDRFPTEWYADAKRVAPVVVIITGSVGLKDSLRLVGDDVVDVVAARNMNGMTRGPLGFGNWLAAVYVGKRPKQGPNTFDFTVRGDMPDHPSPKPLEYMRKLIRRLTEPGDLILDPFGGSGTTALAAIHEDRRCLIFEKMPAYCETIRKRVAEAQCEEPGNLFAPTQGNLFDEPPETASVA